MTILSVKPVVRRDGTFQAQMMLRPGSDEMIECLTHAACFATVEACERLCKRILSTRKFDPAFWLWSPSVCSPYAFMHDAPTANVYPVCK